MSKQRPTDWKGTIDKTKCQKEKKKRKSDIHRKKTKSGDRLKCAKRCRRLTRVGGWKAAPACPRVLTGDGADGPPGARRRGRPPLLPTQGAEGTGGPRPAGGDALTSGQTDEGRSCDQSLRAPGTVTVTAVHTGSGPAPEGKECGWRLQGHGRAEPRPPLTSPK